MNRGEGMESTETSTRHETRKIPMERERERSSEYVVNTGFSSISDPTTTSFPTGTLKSVVSHGVCHSSPDYMKPTNPQKCQAKTEPGGKTKEGRGERIRGKGNGEGREVFICAGAFTHSGCLFRTDVSDNHVALTFTGV